jgi:CheY-like chemotaxis protein
MSALLRNVKILVIDDEKDICALLKVVLGQEGAQVAVATTAYAAMKSCRATRPDAIICDLLLNGTDGTALVQALRGIYDDTYIPAVAITGCTRAADEDRAMAQGFNAYLYKPFELATLVELVAVLVRKYGRPDRRRSA